MSDLSKNRLKTAYEAYTAGKLKINDLPWSEIVELLLDVDTEDLLDAESNYIKFLRLLTFGKESDNN